MLKEIDVKRAFYQTEIKRILEDDPTTLVVDEFGLFNGKSRVDVAVINGKLHAYEIKSASDRLDRLIKQQENYNKIFDKITLVADARHVAEAVKIVPPWWGLISVTNEDGVAALNEIWPARQNFGQDPYALCQLLWREEVYKLLRSNGLSSGIYKKRRKILWKKLAQSIDLEELKGMVRTAIKTRTDWR